MLQAVGVIPMPFDEHFVTTKNGCFMVTGTVCFFHFLNKFVTTSGPDSLGPGNIWKWKNLCCSFVHAVISGIWSVWCVMHYPELLQHLSDFKNPPCYALAAFSTGYFIYDFMDIVLNGKCKRNWEVCLHHVPVCFGMFYNVYFTKMLGYHVVVMLLEVNSIFLHARKLLQLKGLAAQRSVVYRINIILNLSTFVMFRLGALLITCLGLQWEQHQISKTYFVLMFTTLFIIVVINIILFYRLIKNDVLRNDYRINNNNNRKNPS